jgi:hypothetical protein
MVPHGGKVDQRLSKWKLRQWLKYFADQGSRFEARFADGEWATSGTLDHIRILAERDGRIWIYFRLLGWLGNGHLVHVFELSHAVRRYRSVLLQWVDGGTIEVFALTPDDPAHQAWRQWREDPKGKPNRLSIGSALSLIEPRQPGA